MINKTIHSNKQKLDALFAHMKEVQELKNLEIAAQWSTYLCIRVSGFLEISTRSIYSSYCTDKAHANISRYVGHSLEGARSQNMKAEVLLRLAGSFSEDWRQKLKDYLAENGRKEAIDSVINIRNIASHGGTQSVSYKDIREYYDKVWEVIQFMDAQCREEIIVSD